MDKGDAAFVRRQHIATLISASGHRTSTFLITKTPFRIQPSPVSASASALHIPTARYSSTSEPRQTLSPYDKGFKHALWRRGVSKDNVKDDLPEIVHRLRRAIDNAVQQPSTTSPSPTDSTPLPTLPPPDRFSGEDTYLTFALPLLLPSLFTLPLIPHPTHTITRNELWHSQPALNPTLEPALTWVTPDLAYGFSAQRWRETRPVASEQLGLYMCPRRTMAWPFFVCEGKGPKGKAKVAKYQNLSSASLCLRNMRIAHQRAMDVADAGISREPEKHIKGLTLKGLEPRSTMSAPSYSTNPALIGADHRLPTTTSLPDAIAALTPYTTFHRTATVLSAIVTTKTVSLDVHWTSPFPPRPLDPSSSPSSSSASYLNPDPSSPQSPSSSQSHRTYYLRHRLAKWSVRDEMPAARRGLEVAIELVGRETEGRMGAVMDVLEAVGGRDVKAKEKENRVAKSVSGIGSLSGEEEGEVLVAQDRGFL